MREYLKDNNTLIHNTSKMVYLTDFPQNLNIYPEGTLLFIEGEGIYQRTSSSVILLVLLKGIILPVGAIRAVTNTVIPTGWLLCNGSQFSQSDYPDLYTLLGGNVLPDYRYCTPFGLGSQDTPYINKYTQSHKHIINDSGHSHTVTYKPHTHTITYDGYWQSPYRIPDSGTNYWSANSYNGNTYPLTDTVSPQIEVQSALTGVTIGNIDTSVKNPNIDTQPHGDVIALNYIIKAK